MCSAPSSERKPIPMAIGSIALLVILVFISPLKAQQDSSDAVPFRIRDAGEFLQRKTPSGATTYILRDNVLITREQSTISCDSLVYFPDDSIFLCIDSVRVTEPDRSLFCDTLTYYVDQAYYLAVGGLRWSSEDIRGSGNQGEYWQDKDLFRVTGDAFAADSIRELYSDRMEYDYSSEVLRADGEVRFSDSESGSEATAASAMYRSVDELLVLRGRPVLTYFEEDDSLRQDPFNLTGDVVFSFGSDSLASAGRVRLWQDSLTVTADSLFHDRGADISYFRGGPPRVEHPEYNLTAALLDVVSRERKLDRIEAAGGGRGEFWSETQDTTAEGKYVSWIEGDSLWLFFGQNAMDSIYAVGNGRSYYQESAESGANYVQGGVIQLVFEDNQLEVVEVQGGGRGIYLPPDTGGTITVIPDSAGFLPTSDSTSTPLKH